jgi:hypothetical protein
VVSDLLAELAGEDLGRDWLQRQRGAAITKAEAKKWWDRARMVGEEAYLLAHVLPPDENPKEASSNVRTWISSEQLRLIEVKYPRHILPLYKTILDKRPQLDSWMLADAVLRGKFPAKEKLTLFLYAARHKDTRHRLRAFQSIKELDKKQFTSLVLAAIESLPRDVAGPYWTCPEAHFARLALETDDPRVWPLLEKVARRSAVGLRMELLYHVSDASNKRHRAERLRLLESFLDDVTLRDNDSSKKFDGPGAGFHYHRMEVRDFVAMELASLLGIEVELNPERSPQEWAKLRREVRERLKRERGKLDSRKRANEGLFSAGSLHSPPFAEKPPVGMPCWRLGEDLSS